MKRTRKILSILLSVLLIFSIIPLASAAEIQYSGTSGTISWTIDSDWTLTISGTGEFTSSGWSDYKSSIKKAVIGDGVTSIGYEAFSGCTSLTSINIPDSVTSIGNFAFENCNSLTSINIPDGVTSIGLYQFAGCSSIVSITIPNSVTEIQPYAFFACESLTSITIPYSITSICDFAFHNCVSLSSIIVDEANTVYDSRENCNAIIETETNKLIRGCTNTVIPNSVTSIGGYSFEACFFLSNISVPDSVTSIGEGAFSCSMLSGGITIPKTVTSIGESAFEYCNDFSIYGYNNSYAHTYADENSIPFVALDAEHEHTPVKDSAVPATCTSTGLTEGSHCSECGEVIVSQNTVEKTEHNYQRVTSSDVAATCTKDGVEGYSCAICGKSNDKIIFAKGHTASEWKTEIEATCTHEGIAYTECTVCSERLETKVLPLKNHHDGDGDGYCDECDTEINSSNCSHTCHSKNAFLQFIWKMINFFNKLFKINQFCSCGAKHW